jgi:hypothetical protein
MNEMNQLETLLRSWAPRRPSVTLERSLFAPQPEPISAEPPLRLSWLAPATVAGLLLTVLFSQRNSTAFTGPAASGPVVAMILSNQSAAAYLPGSFQREQNIVTANTFEWTNGRASTSSVRSPANLKAVRPRDE